MSGSAAKCRLAVGVSVIHNANCETFDPPAKSSIQWFMRQMPRSAQSYRDALLQSFCHAGNMREWRKTHPLNAEQRLKDSARSYTNVYKRRGRLIPKPCEVCRSKKVQMHHDDYSKPLEAR